jgi:hypothetical protein
MHDMPAEQVKLPPATCWRLRAAIAVSAIVWCSALCACRPHIEDSALALDAATAPVLEKAADAYRDANRLHNLRQDYDAVAEFDQQDKVYNPRDIQVLLSDQDIGARLTVLNGFQVYVKSLCAIASGTNPKELGQASVSVGGQLTTLGTTLLPSIEKAVGIAKDNGASAGAIPPEAQKGVATALDAMGQFLIARKVKKELPGKIAGMDPHVQELARLLESDIDVLKEVERRDYDRIINLQTLTLRQNNDPGSKDRREGIMKLPETVRRQREAEEKLNALRAAVVLLAQTHQQLAADAQGKTPETLNDKLQELASAANELGSFYSSLD